MCAWVRSLRPRGLGENALRSRNKAVRANKSQQSRKPKCDNNRAYRREAKINAKECLWGCEEFISIEHERDVRVCACVVSMIKP